MNIAHKKIGGEFEINPDSLIGFENYNLNNNREIIFSSGRSALVFILKHLLNSNKPIIHIPYYICQSVIDAINRQNYEIRFYELDDDYYFPLDYLENVGIKEVILTIDYFGFVNNNKVIDKIKELREDIIVISDKVQSFFNYTDTTADFSFTSLRKYFALPDGALIHSKNNLRNFENNLEQNYFYYPKLIGSILKFYNNKDELYLKFFAEGESILDNENFPTQSSAVSNFLFSKIDLDHIKKVRLNNCKFVYEIGEKYNLEFLFNYNEDIIPICIPILINNRDEVRRKLYQNNIYLPIHWPKHPYTNNSKKATNLAENVLSIVIDQRYNHEDMEYQLELLIKCT